MLDFLFIELASFLYNIERRLGGRGGGGGDGSQSEPDLE